ncbi:hypothetical protein EPA93_17485 [Ktedonosporobacter rubrisoli]|uniref:Squalene cyclase C-terminal domain-containing protein n=1 Tax=Ktedonosporobacter rubrisoli TaxID=2509675 RepID=A0A4P6JQR7_KTERU|nr:prenyltransferase/squalene oxidase repeat-containing protein [Ktedonosporobacter rubrisoli]QBD77685.1 hypothetical protein EPA93_17485 [Ktedonosporobacter rubrisoli]
MPYLLTWKVTTNFRINAQRGHLMNIACSYDLGQEVKLIDTFMGRFWSQWPEVVVYDVPLSARPITPQDSAYGDIINDCYPFLFYPFFPTVPLDTMRTLAQAGRLYSLYIFLSDKIFDGHLVSQEILRINVIHAEAIHLLYTLFPSDSPFWTHFRNSQHTYNTALQLEQKWSRSSLLDFDLQTAEQIAAGKAAPSTLAVAALSVLDGKPEEYLSALTESLNLANIGLQFYDDLRDWKDDIGASQPSLLLAELTREVGEIDYPDDAEKQEKYLKYLRRHLYRSGIAQAASVRAAHYFTQAQARLNELPTPATAPRHQLSWLRLLGDCQRALAELERDLSRMAGSPQMLKGAQASDSLPPEELPMLDRALSYLTAQQQSDGAWGDFLFSIGHSTDWISGYVGQALIPYPSQHEALKQAMQWLLKTGVNGEWGYNARAPHDADSTSNIGLFLGNLAKKLHSTTLLEETLSQITAQLQRYQHPDGGFSTYIDSIGDNYIVRQHWLKPHTEITATCGRALLLLEGSLTEPVRTALAFVLQQQTSEGSWHAYWYEGPFYGTNQAVKFIKEAVQAGWHDAHQRAAIKQALAFVLRAQKSDGGWALHPDYLAEETQAAPTALALDILTQGIDILLAQESGEKADTKAVSAQEQVLLHSVAQAVSHGLSWLRRNQENDGSWQPAAILRIPDPACTQPWLSQFPRASYGKINHKVYDQQRNFTVATVLHMLNTANKLPYLQELQREIRQRSE